jgi:hypothetical protein
VYEWLKMATAHADCYLEAHGRTRTETTAPTVTAFDVDASATTTTTTSQANAVRRGHAAEIIASVTVGLTVLANAA